MTKGAVNSSPLCVSQCQLAHGKMRKSCDIVTVPIVSPVLLVTLTCKNPVDKW